MSVSFKHPDYNKMLEQWELTSDCLAGSQKIKEQGTKYLPMPAPDDTSDRNLKRYQAYRDRALFVNILRRTLEGLRGAVFRKPPTIQLPSSIDYMRENCDQNGLALEQLAKSVTGKILTSGRHGLLVDFPPAPENRSRREDQQAQYRAYISSYDKYAIINWRTTTVGGVKKLSLVVLEESYEVIDEDGFGFKNETQHRVLRLNENGQYQQEIWRDEAIVTDETRIPTDFTGQPLDFIPFIFVGSENNDEKVDHAPLYDLAEVNISHYRNSADFEELTFVVGQPTLFVSLGDMQAKDFLSANQDRKLTLGVRDGYLLGQNGNANLVQASESNLAKIGQEDKLELMIRLGAKLITEAAGNETATAARIKNGSDTSTISTIADNVSDAFQHALRFATVFNGGNEEEIEFELNKDFFEEEYSAQEVMADIQLYDRSFIGKKEIRDRLRELGRIDPEKTDEQLDNEINEEDI